MLSYDERKRIFDSEKPVIPISAFKAPLSGLEIIVKYLKEAKRMSISEIALTLSRKPSTLYNTYSRAKDKFSGPLDISDDSMVVPIEIFSDRRYAILESLVAFLKGCEKLSFAHISRLLGKSDSTVRTVYRRYMKKKND